jgi:hypothetical protein
MSRELTVQQFTVLPFSDAAALEPGDQVWITTEHAGQRYAQPATVKRVTVRDVTIRDPRAFAASGIPDPEAGGGRYAEVTLRHADLETSVSVLDPRAALGRQHYPSAYLSDKRRRRLLARVDGPVDDGGEGEVLPIVPVYGSEVRLAFLVPGLDPDEALRIARDAVTAAFERMRPLQAKSRTVTDLRYDVIEETEDLDTGRKAQSVIAVNVTRPESIVTEGPSGGLVIVREVAYGRTTPVIGD